MLVGRARFAVFLLSISLACAVPPLLARKKDKDKPPSSTSDQKRALHALNRLTFGPRPGDVQHVMAIGVDKWIDLQLHPEKIDDSALDARLEPFRITRMSGREIAHDFPDGQGLNQVMNGKKPMPSDAGLRMVYEVQIARQQEKKERLQEAAKNTNPAASDSANNAPAAASMMTPGAAPDTNAAADRSPADHSTMAAGMDSGTAGNDMATDRNTKTPPDSGDATPAAPAKLTPEEEEQARRREEQLYTDLEVQQLPSLPADQRFKKILSMSPAAQFSVADSLRGGKGREFLEGLPPKQKEILLAMNNPANVVTGELAQAKL